MKYLILTLILLTGLSLFATTWQTVTNTDHVYDIAITATDIYFSTWGGVVRLNRQESIEAQTGEISNSGSGLSSNDIRSLAYINFSNSLWMGSADQGITIQSPSGMQQLDTNLGLPSARVNRVIEHESTILVATSAGLAVFYYLPGVSFPLMLHQYTRENTGGGLLANNVQDMILTPDGRLFLATSLGICHIPLQDIDNDSAWQTLGGAGIPFTSVSDAKLAHNSTHLAIAIDNKAYRHPLDLNTGSWEVFSSTNGLSGQSVSSVALDSQNSLWVSYGAWEEELLNYSLTGSILCSRVSSTGTVTNWLAETSGLGIVPISRIIVHDSGMYLCSWGEGIFHLVQDTWLNNLPTGIGFPKITQIVADQNYASWYASGNIGPWRVRKGTMGVSRYLGNSWETYNIANSPIHSDNILSVAVDSRNRKWFGTWDNHNSPAGWLTGIAIFDDKNSIWKHMNRSGIRTWNNETESWGSFDPNSPKLTTATIGGIYPATNGDMMVLCYDGGVNILDVNDDLVADFELPNSVEQKVLYGFCSGEEYFFGTNSDRGLVIWNHPSRPQTNGLHWVIPSPPELSNCLVYGVITVDTPYEGKQHWIAASTGLFMWNESSWYRYDTMIKRFKYSTSSYQWVNDTLYYEDEERLFGSVRTTPTSILLDPFNRIWIGSMENGISMYDPSTERFMNFFKPNYPLLSNYITTLGYDPLEGNLLIGTTDGLNTYRIGRTVKPDTVLYDLKAFPNPFYPGKSPTVQIINLPDDSMPAGQSICRIYDASGALVVKLNENAFSRFAWNGRSQSGKECSSGIYFFVVTSENGKTKRGKIALIR